MSEVKVNKISPRSGTTVTLGDSGDTFTIPSGATINNQGTATNFGATGSASWVTTVKTSTFTAVAGEGYFVNTTGGVVSVNLPAGTAGAVVAIKDYANTFDTNAVTLVQNGSDKIGGSTVNATLDTEGIAVTLVFIDSTQGWLVTDDGLQSEASTSKFVTATGGSISTCGNFKSHVFTSPGTFCVSCAGNAGGSTLVDYLVVAGGGGGGGYGGSGGGGGGFRLSNDTCMPAPLTSPLANPTGLPVTATGYPITIGAGGTGGSGNYPNPPGTAGSNSVFAGSSTITSAGGGEGFNANSAGGPGGSGGGGRGSASPGPASANPFAGGSGNTPPVSPSQGNNGGAGFDGRTTNTQGGGGGGAGAVGGDSSSANGGLGGIGSFVVQAGFAGCNGTTGPVSSTRYFAGGGGGGTDCSGGSGPKAGGSGGGGTGSTGPSGVPGGAGTVNTGGGGGAGSSTPLTGGAGGSGIVIIRYKFQ